MSFNNQLINSRRETLKKAGYLPEGTINSSDVAISPWVTLLFFLIPPKLADNVRLEIYKLPPQENLLKAYLRLLFALPIKDTIMTFFFLGTPRPSRTYGLLTRTTTQEKSNRAFLPGTLFSLDLSKNKQGSSTPTQPPQDWSY